jgi:hydrogenase small subunit
LNRISDSAPKSATEILTDSINLVYHTNLMTFAGESSVAALRHTYDNGNYILVVEGGIPTAFGGYACVVYSYNGAEVTMQQAVQELASKALAIICVGTCAAWGGIPAAGSNPTQVVGVKALTGKTTVNIAGCPTNPDWVVWAIVQLLVGNPITLGADGRPTALFSSQGTIHDKCPREEEEEAGRFGLDGQCLKKLGCRGPKTRSRCENCWNGKAGAGHWCIGVNAPCHGCVESTFPGTKSFFTEY